MATMSKPKDAAISNENSIAKPAKKRGAHLAQYQFKPGQSGNLSGRPKGTTAKEMLRRQINRVVVDLQGNPSKDGIVRGDLLSNTVVSRAISGDMRAAAIVYQYDADRPTGVGQGEVVPGTNVQVNVNAQANAQVVADKPKGPDLVDRLRAIYNLGPRPQARSIAG
jgi:hypothetical protein